MCYLKTLLKVTCNIAYLFIVGDYFYWTIDAVDQDEQCRVLVLNSFG